MSAGNTVFLNGSLQGVGAGQKKGLNFQAPIFSVRQSSQDSSTIVEELSFPIGKRVSSELPSLKTKQTPITTLWQLQNLSAVQVKPAPKHVVLFKTEMCHFFVDSGTCPYKEACQYAHHESELRPVTRHQKYKTTLCRQFSKHGICSYGRRCQFIHDSSKLSKQAASNDFQTNVYNTNKQNNFEAKLECLQVTKESQIYIDNQRESLKTISKDDSKEPWNERRLPVFVLLSQGVLPKREE